MLSTKRQLGAALNISDSSLKTSHPWAEASVVVCTGARSVNKDYFYSQTSLACVVVEANASPQIPACNAQPAFLYRKDTSIPLG